MKSKQEEQLEKTIQSLEPLGYRLVRHSFGSEEQKTCCPMRACCLQAEEREKKIIAAAASFLEVDELWVRDFISGWDDDPIVNSEAYTLGKEMQRKYVL